MGASAEGSGAGAAGVDSVEVVSEVAGADEYVVEADGAEFTVQRTL